MTNTSTIGEIDADTSLMRFVEENQPNVGIPIWTTSGQVSFKALSGIAMPAPFAFAYGRELAAKAVGRKLHWQSTFVANLPEAKLKGTIDNYIGATLSSVISMSVAERLTLVGELCDFINKRGDATGFEALLSSAMESCWAYCSDDLAAYAERTWLKYVPTGELAARDGILVVNGLTC